MTKYRELAKQKANQSPTRYKVSAIGLDHKGNLLGSAFSSYRFSRYGGGIHAEMALLHRYSSNVKTILICRVGRSGDILPIDPCPRCQKVLNKLGIKVITMK